MTGPTPPARPTERGSSSGLPGNTPAGWSADGPATASGDHPASARLGERIAAHRSLHDLLHDAARSRPDRPAFRIFGTTVRYGEVLRDADALAAHLQACGIGRGDRVALMLPNVPQHPVALLAALRIGAVVVNVNPLYSPRELALLLADSGARALVLLDLCARTVAEVRQTVPVPHLVVTALGDAVRPRARGRLISLVARRRRRLPGADTVLPDAVPWRRALRDGGRRRVVPVPTGPDDLALLQYTGGTTGAPRGAMLSNRNLISNTLQGLALFELHLAGERTVALVLLPLYHVFSLTVNLFGVCTLGGCSVLVPDPRDARAVARAARGGFEVVCGTSTLFATLLGAAPFRRLRFDRVRVALSGGMALDPAVAAEWERVVGQPLLEGYGLTEASPVLAVTPIGARAPGTVGPPYPLTTLRIVRPDGAAANAGELGEVLARGPQVFNGYWRDDASSAATLADGWLRTGDVGAIDDTGVLRLVDRLKDTVIVGGFNVYPAEVEAVAAGFPGIAECAAIGVPDPVSGERVGLVVRPQPGSTIDPDALALHCRARLAGYKVPRSIVITADPLPRTTIGKVSRRLLRETNGDDAGRNVSRSLQDPGGGPR